MLEEDFESLSTEEKVQKAVEFKEMGNALCELSRSNSWHAP